MKIKNKLYFAVRMIRCTCTSEFQDKEYGKDMRVYSPCVKDGKVTGYRCSVCAKKIMVG